MAEELKEAATSAEKPAEPKKKFMEVAEYRMILYVVPVALVFLVLAIILGK
jgi:type II secretory pathway component PulF